MADALSGVVPTAGGSGGSSRSGGGVGGAGAEGGGTGGGAMGTTTTTMTVTSLPSPPSRDDSSAASMRQAFVPSRAGEGRSDSHGELSRDNSYSGTSNGSSYASAAERRQQARKQALAEAKLTKAAAVGGGKTITFTGGVAFLVNNVTGGGMVLFPQVFQQAGWLVVVLGLLAIIVLASVCGFMLIEAMAMMPGNKRFGKRAEYTSITKHYLPRRLYLLSQLFFQTALLTNNISMIVQSIQVMDFTLAELFGRSCAVPQFYPEVLFHCPAPVQGFNTVFGGDGVYLVPLGWFVLMLVVLPLGMVNLDDNIFVQKGAVVAVLSILLAWTALFAQQGLDMTRVPAVGNNFTSVLGVIVFNFAAITSIPSWVNEKKESVSIERSFALAMPLAGCMFVLLGLVGGMAFPPFEHQQTILQAVYNLGTKLAKITFFLFPACVNLTSIPVFSIMQRYNLLESGVCGRRMAVFIAVVLPWLVAIPLYTGSGYQLLVTWSGILVTSVVNFVVPPVLYLLAIKQVKANLQRRQSIKISRLIRMSSQVALAGASRAGGGGGGGAGGGGGGESGNGGEGGLTTAALLAGGGGDIDASPRRLDDQLAMAQQSTQSRLEATATATAAAAAAWTDDATTTTRTTMAAQQGQRSPVAEMTVATSPPQTIDELSLPPAAAPLSSPTSSSSSSSAGATAAAAAGAASAAAAQPLSSSKPSSPVHQAEALVSRRGPLRVGPPEPPHHQAQQPLQHQRQHATTTTTGTNALAASATASAANANANAVLAPTPAPALAATATAAVILAATAAPAAAVASPSAATSKEQIAAVVGAAVAVAAKKDPRKKKRERAREKLEKLGAAGAAAAAAAGVAIGGTGLNGAGGKVLEGTGAAAAAAAAGLHINKHGRVRKKRELVADDGELPRPPLGLLPSPFVMPPACPSAYAPLGFGWARALWVVLLPLSVALHFTVVDPGSLLGRSTGPSGLTGSPLTVIKPARLALWAALSIAAALAWVAALTYMLVWSASLVSQPSACTNERAPTTHVE